MLNKVPGITLKLFIDNPIVVSLDKLLRCDVSSACSGSWPLWRPRPARSAASPAARIPCTNSPRRKASSPPSGGSSARRRRADWPTWHTDRSWWIHKVGAMRFYKCRTEASRWTDFSTDILLFILFFSCCRSDHDGRGHGRPGHGRGQAGNTGWEGPQVKKEVSFIQSTASVVSMAQKSQHHITKTTTVNMRPY